MKTDPTQAHLPVTTSRRDFLFRAGGGFGGLALSAMLAKDVGADPLRPNKSGHGAQHPISPLAPKEPHFNPKAKAVILLFMVGGPSHMDTWDPKPELERLNGQDPPPSFGVIKSQFIQGGNPLLKSSWKFNKHGQSGIEVSELFPHLSSCVDDMAVIRSCFSESFIHAPAMYQMVNGRIGTGHPSMGSWVTYGLGSASENLPAYCVMPQPQGLPEGSAPMWEAAYLPAVYQGTVLRPGANPILNLKPPAEISKLQQRHILDYMREMNEQSLEPGASDLAARIESYELAFRMQQYAPEAVDLSRESPDTKSLYGVDQAQTQEFGTRCLLARRLVERGVRFVTLFSGGGPVTWQWDAHDNVVDNHTRMCGATDKPIAGLLKDLKRRGMLDETLVIWATEFGRTPISQSGKGRDHNPEGFSIWMAGGGIKGGTVVGATDDIGYKAVVDRAHPRDIHATILHLLGLDHMRLTYLHNGRRERLTDFGGDVIHKVVA
jgi:hypothetical protein